jgi:hypothetical protein
MPPRDFVYVVSAAFHNGGAASLDSTRSTSEDPVHAHATELFAQAERESWHLVTTNAVVYETHALLTNRAREGREVAGQTSAKRDCVRTRA